LRYTFGSIKFDPTNTNNLFSTKTRELKRFGAITNRTTTNAAIFGQLINSIYVQSAKKERTNQLNSKFDKTYKNFSVLLLFDIKRK